MNWRLWIYGLVAAVITAAASAAGNVFVLPTVLNGITTKKLFIVTGLNALIAGVAGMLAYLKNHPVPSWTGTERRTNGQTTTAQAVQPTPTKEGI